MKGGEQEQKERALLVLFFRSESDIRRLLATAFIKVNQYKEAQTLTRSALNFYFYVLA